MTLVISIESTAPYLTVKAVGRAGLTELMGLVMLVHTVAWCCPRKAAVVDLERIEPELSFTENLKIGGYAAEVLLGLECVCAVVPPACVDAPAFKASRLGGYRVRTFLTRAQASAWLARLPDETPAGELVRPINFVPGTGRGADSVPVPGSSLWSGR